MSVRQKLQMKLKEKREERKPRGFRGFKAVLKAEADDIVISSPVRYAKITSRVIDEALNIIAKSRSLGVPVQRKLLGEYHYGFVTDDGVEVDAADVEYYQIIDGQEIPVEKFKRTKTLEVINYIDRAKIDNYLIESLYEIWSDVEGGVNLWRFAEWLNNKDKMAVVRFTFGNSFIEYYGLIYPHIEGDRYVLVMALTRMNIEYNHLMPIKPVSAVEREQPKQTIRSVLRVKL